MSGKQLAAFMLKYGFDQKSLAIRFGIHRDTVRRMLRRQALPGWVDLACSSLPAILRVEAQLASLDEH